VRLSTTGAASAARVRPNAPRRLPRIRFLLCSCLVSAALLVACESGSSQGTAQTDQPASSAAATPVAGGGEQNPQPAQPAPAQQRKSFFDQIQATGSLTHTEIQHLPRGAACTPHVSISPASAAKLGNQPDLRRKVANTADSTLAWDIDLPNEAPPKPANVIWNVDCELSGQTTHVGPIVRPWTQNS
jgi:hypothetical protein